LPELEQPLLKIKLPEMEEKEVYLIRLETGEVVARTKEELEKAPPAESAEGAKGSK